MPLVTRNFDVMVEAILDRIIAANVGFDDRSRGSFLRTMVEAIVSEIDIQYYQLSHIYNAMDIDTSSGSDLSRLVSVLGTIRNLATKAIGVVRFSRSTVAANDIPIPFGTVMSTKPDANGDTIEFSVSDVGKILLPGETYIDCNVIALNPRRIYIAPEKLCVMVDPVVGVESAMNVLAIDSGSDEESDIQLRERSKLALSGLGKGTTPSLISAVMEVDSVVDVGISDMARGPGTTDISIVCTTMPPTQDILDEINTKIDDTKSAGIDVLVVYPTVINVDVTITLTRATGYTTEEIDDAVGQSILNYFGSLGIGASCIRTQLQSSIIRSSNGIIDMVMTAPEANVVATSSQILRVGVITIDGQVWQLG